MYLTRAYLNPRRRNAVTLLGNPRALHALLAGCLPDEMGDAESPDGPKSRMLWRLDADNARRPVVWVVSASRPDLTQLIEDAGWPAAELPQWESRPYQSVIDRITNGQRFAFRLTASPTYTTAPPDRHSRGRRLPHTTVPAQLNWLTEMAPRHGFRILPVTPIEPPDADADGNPPLQLQLSTRNKQRFRKPDGPGRSNKKLTVTLTQATYEGALEVTDTPHFTTTLTTGIGRARAYGCGLLTLAQLPTQPTEITA